MEQNNQDLQERRDARRRRRQRNQVLAYLTVIILIGFLATGIVMGVSALTNPQAQGQSQAQSHQTQESSQMQVSQTEESKTPEEKVNEILASEEDIEPPAPTSEVEEPTPEEKLDEKINEMIANMTTEEKVAGLFIVTPEQITGVSAAVQAGEGTQKALEQYAVGGLVYSNKNMRSQEQLRQMLENTQPLSKYPLFLAVEEEGGSVGPVAATGLVGKVDSAQTIGETGDANNAYVAGTTIGTYLSDLGFNLDFAAVADLANVENSVMAGRSYGSDAATVSDFVTSMMQGLEEKNVTACLKHFPGIGSSTEDTHDGLASTDRSKEEFQANEFVVFQAGIDAGADMIMVSHMSAPSLTGDNIPSTFSKDVVTNILRDEMNFKGVIITDALNMSAISEYYSSEQAAVYALRAGCDMLLMPENFEEAYNGVLTALQEGTISEERINDSLRRIYRIKYADEIEQ